MLGGNKKSQDAFFKYFVEIDTNNIILAKIKTMLADHSDLTKKSIAQKNVKLAQLYKLKVKDEQLAFQDAGLGMAVNTVAEADMEEESGEDLLTIELSDEEGEGSDGKDPSEEVVPTNP